MGGPLSCPTPSTRLPQLRSQRRQAGGGVHLHCVRRHGAQEAHAVVQVAQLRLQRAALGLRLLLIQLDVLCDCVVEEGLGRFLFAGTADISLVTDRLGVQIDREGFETVGGYLMTQLGRVPTIGEQLDVDGLHIEVLNVERRRIQRVRITKHDNKPVAESEHAL